jgi:hypothetical protein
MRKLLPIILLPIIISAGSSSQPSSFSLVDTISINRILEESYTVPFDNCKLKDGAISFKLKVICSDIYIKKDLESRTPEISVITRIIIADKSKDSFNSSMVSKEIKKALYELVDSNGILSIQLMEVALK